MSNNKHFADLLKVCSILPALAIMPAMADEAKIGADSYPTLFEALSVAQSIPGSVVTLTGTVLNGSGKTIAEGADLTVDFGGNTYVAVKHAAGSEGTKTQMFQLLKDSDITFKNGTLSAVSSDTDKFKMMLQNYSNLTLDNMVVDGRGELVQYVVSNNNGVTKIKNSKILASDGVALDVYYWPQGGYSDVSVDVENTEIVGNIEVFVDGTRAIGDAKHELTISGGVLAAQTNGKSKINNQGTLILKDVDMDGNKGAENGSAIYNSVVLTGDKEVAGRGIVQLENVDFENNSANGSGGAIYNAGTLNVADAIFDGNESQGWGGAIYNTSANGELYVKDAQFLNNTATCGAAIAAGTSAKSTVIENSLFQDNTATSQGTVGLFSKGTLTDVIFKNNKVTNAEGDGAGALFLGSESQSVLTGNSFVGNASAANGGAIATRVAQMADGKINRNYGTLDIDDSEFVSNSVDGNGGAIYNSFHDSVNAADAVYVHDVEFVANSAKGKGGAIYNDGKQDLDNKGGVMSLSDVDFAKNTAGNSGGAIFNNGKLSIADAEFEGNKSEGWGGAIYNTGADGSIVTAGELYVKDAQFLNNTATCGAAIAAGISAKSTVIENSLFQDNTATSQGTVGLFSKGTLTDVIFKNNKVTNAEGDGAGALFLGSESQSVLTGNNFVGNASAANGGAIATRVAQNEGGSKNRNYGTLDIDDSEFVSNSADGNGGAIYNSFHDSVNVAGGAYVAKSSFLGNKATNGGAIYNDGTQDLDNKGGMLNLSDLTFADNIASDKGGAIFNGADAVINMSGTNAFTNNTANKGANDIYNAGTLNITGGETTIGGGILGNGTLTLAKGAVLNVGNATIRQDKLDIDGIVKVSVLSDRSYGRLIAARDLDVADTAELHLSLGSVGEYDMFGGQDAGFKTIEYGDTYNVTELDGGIIKVETKSIEQLAQDTGLTTQAAGVVAGLANSHDSTLQHISLAAQQALNAGNKALVEHEAKKLNPESKPVVQAVASSVQNQVLSLATGRMSGGAVIGRAGGDSSQENGFWMHGLFNKSKLDGQFHGYTRGVAFGMDTIIDGKYILGGGLAFNNSDVHSSGRGNTDIDSKTLFLYGQYKPNKWFANMSLTYSMSEYDETKSVFGYNINNVYDVDSYGAQIMTGYDFASGVTTEAGLRYLHIAQDAYSDVSATDTDFLTSVAGIKYAFAIENDWAIELRPELRAALTYDIISEADAAVIDMPGVASYQVAGDNLKRLGGEFGIGLTADYKGLKVTLMYDLDLHKDYTSQTGMIKLRTQF